MYAQIINNHVNLVGDEEVGLPLPQQFLDDNPHILNIDITDIDIIPELGWFYENGIFYTPEEWNEIHPPIEPEIPINGVTNEEIKEELVAINNRLDEIIQELKR